MAENEQNEVKERKCPICGKPMVQAYHPFCSKKCADIDLGRWLKGTYVIHTDERPKETDFADKIDEEKE